MTTGRTSVLIAAQSGWIEAWSVAGFASPALLRALLLALSASRRPLLPDLRG